MTAITGRESDKFMLRIPNGMRDRIKVAAAQSSRSMNAEIVSRLEASFGRDNEHASQATDRPLDATEDLRARVENLEQLIREHRGLAPPRQTTSEDE